MEYDSSELYYEKSEGSECTPSQLTNQKSGKKSRNLEDRVREYTGYMQDEDPPVYYSTERSSDSCSPFLVARGPTGTNRRGPGTLDHRRGTQDSRRGTSGDRRGATSPRYVQDAGLALSERLRLPGNFTPGLRETTIDTDYLRSGGGQTQGRPPDLLSQNSLKIKSHRRSYSEDSTYARPEPVTPTKDCVGMPGFPVQTLTSSTLPIPYSPSREKGMMRSGFVCSWRLVSVCLTILTLLLSSIIIYFGAVRYTGEVTPPLPNSVIDSSGFQDSACIPLIDTQQEQSFNIDSEFNPRPRNQLPSVNLIPDQWLKSSLEPFSFWSGEMEILTQSFYYINITALTGGRNVAVYGKYGSLPSITQHDFSFFLNSGSGIDPMFSHSEYLKVGNWFFSVYNDDQSRLIFGLVIAKQKERGNDCGNSCNGHGSCIEGRCVCTAGWTGPDCLNRLCPVVCSGHGDYGGGFCHCHLGWKGDECNLRMNECSVSECGEHGECVEGACICTKGWEGPNCTTRSCMDPTCSGHGSCQSGECQCDLGWSGHLCNQENMWISSCLPDCTGHGTYNMSAGTCSCTTGWTGQYCNISSCSLDCGVNGECLGSACACKPGWEGYRCEMKSCSSSCQEHGECRNGTCLCREGWNGRNCGLEGCEKNCFGNGDCLLNDGEYSCTCKSGWTGEHCNLKTETECQDGLDNDKDGLVDCGDSNCCSHPACSENIMCVYFADPLQVVSNGPLAPPSSSFFDQVKFLILGEKSVQSYAKQEFYEEERASVVRGRVLTRTGEGIIGVRVSVDRNSGASNYGFTLTRPGGWFDMLVNGGGAVTLQFQRSPFKPLTRTSHVPWNEIHVLEPIIMSSSPRLGISWAEEDSSQGTRYTAPCVQHDPEVKPHVAPSYSSADQEPSVQQSVNPDTGVLTQSIKLPGSKLYLVYQSSPSSVLTIFLTPFSSTSSSSTTSSSTTTPSISFINNTMNNLFRIHIKITIAGVVTRKQFEVEEGLLYTFSWDKLNVYKQRVYGAANARISVGYQYTGCQAVIWYSFVQRLEGYRAQSTDIGGWNLNIHHSLNTGLDAGEFYEEDLQGSGHPRDFNCETTDCSSSLLNVVSLAAGPDGSVYIGDYNLVRRLYPDGRLATVLQFKSKQGSFLYDITMSPADDGIYLTNSEAHQVWRISKLEKVDQPSSNWEVVAGTGEKCTPGDSLGCGDGGPAKEAKLTFPKGIAVSIDRTIYVTDGKRLRMIDQSGVITTIVGDTSRGHLTPISCGFSMLADKVDLHWPGKLGVNPVDGTLHIVDENQVLKLTSDKRLEVAAGLNMRCKKGNRSVEVLNLELGPILDMGFSPDGSLLVAENRGEQGFSLHRISFSGEVTSVFKDRVCLLCKESSGTNFGNMSSRTNISDISALVTDPAGNIILADNNRLRLSKLMPAASIRGTELRVKNRVGEIIVFNRYGQHESTLLPSGQIKYSFDYSSTLGTLSKITDSIGNKIILHRDYTGTVKRIENTFGEQILVQINSKGLLESVKNSQIMETNLQYSQDGLLTQLWTTVGDLFTYQYNSQGRLVLAITPTGETIQIRSDPSCLSKMKVCNQVLQDGKVIQPDSPGARGNFLDGKWNIIWKDEGKGVDVEDALGRVEYSSRLKGGLLPVFWNSIGSAPCNNTFDGFGRLLRVICGSATSEFTYTSRGNMLNSRSSCNQAVHQYTYTDTHMPREIDIGGGRKYTYVYDPFGGLEHVVLPNGGRHVFGMEQTPGSVRVFHGIPGVTGEFSLRFDIRGNRIETEYPEGSPITLIKTTEDGNPAQIVAGDRVSNLEYTVDGLLSGVQHIRDISIRTRIRFIQFGVMAEQRINFDAKSALADAKFSYDYWNNLNIQGIKGRIGGQQIPRVGFYQTPTQDGKIPNESGNFYYSLDSVNGTKLSDGNAIYLRTESLVTLSINTRDVFTAEYKFNSCNKLQETKMLLKRSSGFFKQTKKYSYDDAGQLVEVQENTFLWKYEYDRNGNMKNLVFGKTVHAFEYNAWDQLVRYNTAELSYDGKGKLVKNHKQFQFKYGSNNLLIEASHARTRKKIFYFYDHLDRLVGRRDDEGRITQFYYSNPETPYLVSHIYLPREDSITSLVYDAESNLIFAQVHQDQYYIISDQTGAPFLFFSHSGNLVKEVNRSPFGQITYDSNPELSIPLGPGGGIVDPDTGVLHLQGNQGSTAFDPFLGIYLVPAWEDMLENIYKPELFHAYRRNGNDPVNSPLRFAQGFPNFAEILGGIIPKFESSARQRRKPVSQNLNYLAQINKMVPVRKPSDVSQVSSHLLADSSVLMESPTNMEFPLARREPILGKFIVLSQLEERVNVVSGPQANQIYNNVFTSVLNNSFHTNIHTQLHGKTVWHFTKSNLEASTNDIVMLRRLGSAVNLTVHDGVSDNRKVVDVRVHVGLSIINIRYGVDAVKEKNRLIRHALRSLSVRVWEEELERDVWSTEEKNEMIAHGSLQGWELEYSQAPALYPQLAWDRLNIHVVRSRKHSLH